MICRSLCIGCAFACALTYAVVAEDVVSDPTAEKAKIEFLLKAIIESKLTFIRNDEQCDAVKAAEHLRTKWNATGNEVKTARQFIELCASKSSTTGKAYEIILADGKTRIPSAAWFETILFAHELTKTILKGKPAAAPSEDQGHGKKADGEKPEGKAQDKKSKLFTVIERKLAYAGVQYGLNKDGLLEVTGQMMNGSEQDYNVAEFAINFLDKDKKVVATGAFTIRNFLFKSVEPFKTTLKADPTKVADFRISFTGGY